MKFFSTYPSKVATSLLATVALVAIAGSAEADHRHPTCNPRAEAHIKTAIRLMDVACGKPYHVSRNLAHAAVTHLSLATRFTRLPVANSELFGAQRKLERFAHSCHASPEMIHRARAQTQFALRLERGLCACGNPHCRDGRCAAPVIQSRPYGTPHDHNVRYGVDPRGPRQGIDFRTPVWNGYQRQRGWVNHQNRATDFGIALADRWGQVRIGF